MPWRIQTVRVREVRVDQSELRQAEAARLHSEERLRSFLNALDDLAFELDEGGKYLNVWTRNEDTLLLPKQEILGKSLRDIHGEEEGARYSDVLARVAENQFAVLTIDCGLRAVATLCNRLEESVEKYNHRAQPALRRP